VHVPATCSVVFKLELDAEVFPLQELDDRWRLSLSLPDTRTWSDWIDACTLILESLIAFTISLACPWEFPAATSARWRTVPERPAPLAIGKVFDRHSALHEFALQNIDHALKLVLIIGHDHESVLSCVMFDLLP